MLHLDLTDASFTVTGDGIWSTLEPCLGIVNACLPLFQPLGQKVSGVFAWSTARSGNGYPSQRALPGDPAYHWSGKKGSKATPNQKGPHRDSVPLTGDQWEPEEIEAGWAIETGTPMEPIHQTSPFKGPTSSGGSDANSIQVTKGWEIDRRKV